MQACHLASLSVSIDYIGVRDKQAENQSYTPDMHAHIISSKLNTNSHYSAAVDKISDLP